MASIKVKFQPSTAKDREGHVCYQIIHCRKARRIVSSHQIFPAEWDDSRSIVRLSATGERREYLLTVCELIRGDVLRLGRIIKSFEDEGREYLPDEVVDEYWRCMRDGSLFSYMEVQIRNMKRNRRHRMAEIYRTTLNSFRKFRNGEDIMLDCLNGEIVKAYETWNYTERFIVRNTVAFYMRTLRAVYRRAIDEGLTPDRRPFRHVYTGIEKTVKRALPLSVLREIKNLDLKKYPDLDYARDMFMLSFMLRGMSMVDMAFLRKNDLKDGYISYRRRKTGQSLTISWMPEMQAMIDKYGANQSDYLLPILRRSGGGNDRWRYLRLSRQINSSLKKVGQMAGAPIPITLYVARHSWASVAKSSGVPLSVISESMGHDSEKTTRIYLASLDSCVVDRANSLVLRLLREGS
ncbi:MAG: site-specific integrase [Muribaculaceae bacterium]|nr:site-specific integrase [Muribaculaceae bacterium]